MNRHWWIWLLIGLGGFAIGTQRLLMTLFHGYGPGKHQFALMAMWAGACVLLSLEHKEQANGRRLDVHGHASQPRDE